MSDNSENNKPVSQGASAGGGDNSFFVPENLPSDNLNPPQKKRRKRRRRRRKSSNSTSNPQVSDISQKLSGSASNTQTDQNLPQSFDSAETIHQSPATQSDHGDKEDIAQISPEIQTQLPSEKQPFELSHEAPTPDKTPGSLPQDASEIEQKASSFNGFFVANQTSSASLGDNDFGQEDVAAPSISSPDQTPDEMSEGQDLAQPQPVSQDDMYSGDPSQIPHPSQQDIAQPFYEETASPQDSSSDASSQPLNNQIVAEEPPPILPSDTPQPTSDYPQPLYPPTEEPIFDSPGLSPSHDFVENQEPQPIDQSQPGLSPEQPISSHQLSHEDIFSSPPDDQHHVQNIEPPPFSDHVEQPLSPEIRPDFQESPPSHLAETLKENDTIHSNEQKQADESLQGELEEKRHFTEILLSLFHPVKKLFAHIDSGIIKNCLLFAFLAVTIYVFYTFHLYQTIYQSINRFLNPPKPIPVEVHINQDDLNQWGINTAFLFAKQKGSLADRLDPDFKAAFYFGALSEPQVQGETGITPAYYYGLLRDQDFETNQFISYVKNLRTLQELYNTDVYAMLDQTAQRGKKLLDYLDQLRAARENSNTLRREIGAEIDDLKVSADSLSPDLKKYNDDFFDALKNLAGEKADFLLKSYTDIGQKNVTLTARLKALQKIAGYYDIALKNLDNRIEAVDKNRDALIQGIHVVDIPGGNLDIIIKP